MNSKLKNIKKYGLLYFIRKVQYKIGMSSVDKSIFSVQKYYEKLPLINREKDLCDWYEKAGGGGTLHLDAPETFNEKIQWMKLYESTPLKTRLADKYAVREWVKEKIGEEYLIPLLGVWDSFDEIDFSTLPNQYVLQCNHGSGMVVIIRDDQPLNKKQAKKKFDCWMKINFAYVVGLELQYRDIPHKIVATQYMENIAGDLYDYKFYCFNGEPNYIQVITGRHSDEKMAFYDLNWNKQLFYNANVKFNNENILKPKQLNKAIELAKKLSEGFAFVRVDLYLVGDNEIYFGEMTFTPASGFIKWTPESANKMLGDLITLPDEKYILK